MRFKNTKRTISYHINNNFRDYAIYTLQSRGIPSFDDSLTTVQRYILKSAKIELEKTISLLGNCMSSGYSHGDSSLAGAIAKLTREFNCSDNILDGKGFWGTPVVNEPAAPRYTSVKIRHDIKQNYLKYGYLDQKIDDVWKPLYFEVPIGLTSFTTGIAVGYKSIILPRKIDDIKKFMAGSIKEVKPFFKNFKGTVKKHKVSGGWLITGTYTIDEKNKTIHIEDVPHLLKYASFMKKIYKQVEFEAIDCKILNDSSEKINVKIIYKKQDDLKKLVEIIDRNIKIIVQESIVFVKDNSVITYKKIEDYLLDYQLRVKELLYKDLEFKVNVESFNLDYEKAKLEFLTFMTAKKRTRIEVLDFLKGYNDRISSKLDTIKLTKLNKETIDETKLEIKRLTDLLKQYTKSLNESKKIYEAHLKDFKYTGNITSADNSLFEDSENDEIDGIQIFNINDNDELEDSDDENVEQL
jgi:hypothetical protein